MANAQLGSKAVGSIVKLKVNGTATEFIVVHQGKPSSMYDESCTGTWLLMKDIYENGQWHTTNIREYQYSGIHNYLNDTFFNLFDENIRGSIKQVKIPYLDTPDFLGTVAIKSGANGLPCKIFPLSGYEVGWTEEEDDRFWADGAKLDYFAAGTGTSANSKRIAKLNGSAANWWLRSPYTTNKDTVWYVSKNGSYSNDTVTVMCGIRPALVLPQVMEVDSSGNVVMPIGTHKTLVNGTAYTVKCGKCLVNGTVYNILKGRTLINGTGYDIAFKPPYDPVFANNTWEQIIEACHNNEVPDTWNVADQKPMTINGVDYLIDIIGKNHDTYTDGGTAPLTFQLHDCYGTKYQMNSSNTNSSGWTSCAMRSTHLPAILALMPSEVQAGIKEVNKLTSEGSINITINTTADKLFLLSEIEIFGSTTYSKSGEGSQYAYYSAGNSKVKNLSGSAYNWWERSLTGSAYFCRVNNNGTADRLYASNSRGVAFAFCF